MTVERGQERVSAAGSWRDSLVDLGRETMLTSWELIKITVPVLIVTRLLEQIGAVTVIGELLAPVMAVLGLPGELGLVWATGMLTTIYGAMAAFATLAPSLDLTGAQLTVLCSALLFAHALPIELSISRRAGAGVLPILLLRLGGAILYCWLLDRFCRHFGLWQEPAKLLFAATTPEPDHLSWALQQGINIGLIILVIFGIVVAMRLLRRLRILALFENLLAPVLPHFGMGREAAPITVVGMIMGIGYGGALIIREAGKGGMSRAEKFFALALMGLCHGLVEDTLLMLALGGNLAGIFFGRILFSLVVIYLLVRIVRATCPSLSHSGG